MSSVLTLDPGHLVPFRSYVLNLELYSPSVPGTAESSAIFCDAPFRPHFPPARRAARTGLRRSKKTLMF